ncbi:MAG: VOC family protein [Caldilineaceae bacterium]|nr:VOC family protein [Caldilineaceae bacterium]
MRQLVELALFTDDVPALTAFYVRLLGGEPSFSSDQMALFQLDGLHILIHHRVPPDPEYKVDSLEPPNEDHFAIGVKGLDDMWSESGLSQLSAAIEPTDYPWGRSAYVRDPDGRLVEMQAG